jgi:sigma-B regulation protein RsbU (phosphoserine phosphatase)
VLNFKRKISAKIFYSIFWGTLFIFSVQTIVNYLFTKNSLEKLTNNVVERTFRSAYNQVESLVLPIMNSARYSAFTLTEASDNKSVAADIIKNFIQLFPESYGSGIILSDVGNINSINLYQTNHKNKGNNQQPHLFKACPKRVSSLSSEPYEITLKGDTISLNYFYKDDKRSIYILYDFRLSYFTNILNRETRYLDSRHYLFSAETNLISNSFPKVDSNIALKEKDLQIIRKYLERKKYGFFHFKVKKTPGAIYISKIRGTNLILASVLQTDEVNTQIRKFYLFVFVVSILSIALLAYYLQRIILKHTRPILELSKIGRLMEKGKIHTEIPEYHENQEVEQLAKTLRTVQGRMQNYVANLHSTLKEKRALTKDLTLAEKIQKDMLPPPDSGITNIPEVDIYCRIKPAKGVAGDFYDYFYIDDDRLFFVLGDVSGKSIPAALFMVKTISLLQVEARKGKDPGQIFTVVNEQLTFRNDEGMFVTAIGGTINLKTGEVFLCDAGHHQPLTNINSPNFNYTLLPKNLPLGILTGGRPYRCITFNLTVGDAIILYSDGLPEATNVKDEMLGHEPVEKELADSANLDVSVISKKIWNLYERYTDKAIGNDDISLFILKYTGEV